MNTYTGILFSHEKNGILPFVATWMNLEDIMLSEISQTEKKNTIWFHLYVEAKKINKQNKPEIDS